MAKMPQVWVKSMNWANCQQMMNKVVLTEMDRMFFQPGLIFLVVTLTASI